MRVLPETDHLIERTDPADEEADQLAQMPLLHRQAVLLVDFSHFGRSDGPARRADAARAIA
jgi:hypothetical protein